MMNVRSNNKSYPNDDCNAEDEEIAGVISIRDFLPLFSRSSSIGVNNTNNAAASKAIPITIKDISSDLRTKEDPKMPRAAAIIEGM